MQNSTIRIASSDITLSDYQAQYADSVILTKDKKILLQKRPQKWKSYDSTLTLFGGHVEEGEDAITGVIRELHEELGAKVAPNKLVKLGALTEDFTNHKDLIHVFFWHDAQGTITGCYEWEAITFNTIDEALSQNNLMDYAHWALLEAKKRALVQVLGPQP